MPIPDQTALVRKIKDELTAKGQTFTTNCDAFQITARVAWALRNQGAKLFVKAAGQNGCTWSDGVRYSHDAIAFADGWVDCLASAGPPLNTNNPTWLWHTDTPGGALATPFNVNGSDTSTTHKYTGGGHDTGMCDQCGLPRTNPVHAIPEAKVNHDYDGGEQDTGLCDICQLPNDNPIHTKADPSDPVGRRVAALEARVQALEAASIQYGRLVAFRTNNGHVICAEGGGGSEVNATRKIVGTWETFLVEKP